MSAFFYLPEDRIKEAQMIAKEQEDTRNKRAARKYPQDKTSQLVLKLRTSIENFTPKALTERAMIRKQFALFDTDGSGVVDYREFRSAIKKFLNGVEDSTIKDIFEHFDADKSGTLSVEEYADMLLKEEGPHNYSYKEYKRVKPEKAPSHVSSRRAHSKASDWTSRVRNKAEGSYSNGSNPTTRITKSTRTSGRSTKSSSDNARDLRFAQRAIEGNEPLNQQQIEKRLGNLIIEERRLAFCKMFRQRVKAFAGKENKGALAGKSGSVMKKARDSKYKNTAANTLHWVLVTYANASKKKPREGKIGKRRFLAALEVFRPKTSPPFDPLATESLWEKCNRGHIDDFIDMVFLMDQFQDDK